MQDNNTRHDRPSPIPPQPEIDYTPKKYNLDESILIMLKLFSVTGIIFLLLWFFESH